MTAIYSLSMSIYPCISFTLGNSYIHNSHVISNNLPNHAISLPITLSSLSKMKCKLWSFLTQETLCAMLDDVNKRERPVVNKSDIQHF